MLRFPSKLKHPFRLLHTSSAVSPKRVAEQNCLSLLSVCDNFHKLTQLHSHILKSGLQSNLLVLTKFASTSSDIDAINYASSFLFAPEAKTHLYDNFIFNTVIRAFAQTQSFKRNALFYYIRMVKDGILPNKFTYPFVLKACAGIGDLSLGQMVHGCVLKYGFVDEIHVLNTMIHMYCSCSGGVDFGRVVFDEIPKSDSVTWSAMIGGYAKLGMSAEAIDLFREMQISGVSPAEVTILSVLPACTASGALELGKWLALYIDREKFWKNVDVCNALIDMFAKCGDVDKALRLFRNMDEKNIVSWTSVIVGLAMHGRGLEAVSLFEEMKSIGVVPDDVAYIGLLSACSHSGLVDEGRKYFYSMMNEFGIQPKIEHYGCMVDLLSRAGLVKEAIDFVQKMPIEPNPIILRTLITACRAHGELELGERIIKQLIEAEPLLDSNYVLLSNIYGKMSRWEKKTTIREAMGNRGIRKVPGSTMIEIDGQIHEFVAGDKSQDQHEEVYEMLDEMAKKMKRAGYVARTSEVILDVVEEDKEDTLNRHSEKLAIAFSLLKTPPGTMIRIVKNLRVCEDCHSAAKFVSEIYRREIVMRDRNRFHHFKDGKCSCRDFW